MIKSVIFINEDDRLTFRAYNEDYSDYKECYDKMALEFFDKVVKWDNNDKPIIADNGNNKTLIGKEFDVTFEDYEKTIKRIYEIKKKRRKDILKHVGGPVVIGAAATAVIGTLASKIIDMSNNDLENKTIFKGEPISIEEIQKSVIEEPIQVDLEEDKKKH